MTVLSAARIRECSNNPEIWANLPQTGEIRVADLLMTHSPLLVLLALRAADADTYLRLPAFTADLWTAVGEQGDPPDFPGFGFREVWLFAFNRIGQRRLTESALQDLIARHFAGEPT